MPAPPILSPKNIVGVNIIFTKTNGNNATFEAMYEAFEYAPFFIGALQYSLVATKDTIKIIKLTVSKDCDKKISIVHAITNGTDA